MVHFIDYTYKRVSTYVRTYTLPTKKNIALVLEQIVDKQRKLSAIGIENVVSIDEVPSYEEMFPPMVGPNVERNVSIVRML